MSTSSVFAQPAGVLNYYDFPANDSNFNTNGAVLQSQFTKEYFHLGYGNYIYKLRNNKELLLPLWQNIKPRAFEIFDNHQIVGIVGNTLQLIFDTNVINLWQGEGEITGNFMVEEDKKILFTVTRNNIEYLYSYTPHNITILDSGFACRVFRNQDSCFYIKGNNEKSTIVTLKFKNQTIRIDTINVNARMTVILGYANNLINYACGTGYKMRYPVINNKELSTMYINGLSLNACNSTIYNESGKENYASLFDLVDHRSYDIYTTEKIKSLVFNRDYHSILTGSEKYAKLFFTYLKKYPFVFQTHSKNIYGLAQTEDGDMLAGYNYGKLSIINQNKITPLNFKEKVLDGAITVQGGVLFGTENANLKCLYYYKKGRIKEIKLPEPLVSLCMFVSKNNILYYTSLNKGIWYAKVRDVLENKANWKSIPVHHVGYNRMYALTEDSLHRIWFGQPKLGIGYFYPDRLEPHYFQINDGGIDARSMVVDSLGTIWVGSGSNGLYTIHANKEKITLQDIKKVIHPFFYTASYVRAIILKGNKLIINLSDKTLVLDLDKFYHQEINIKYLTERESNYSAQPEHNTLILAKDSSVWYSTGDMLYQWFFNEWLSIPKEKITINTTLQNATSTDTLRTTDRYNLKPTQNSFTLEINYFHPDLLPRYVVYALQYERDSIIFSKPQTNTTFQFSNLQSGNYYFHVKVLELDGTTSYYKYQLCIDIFWWQKWWVLSLIGLAISSTAFLFYFNYQKRKRTELEARNKSLELEQLKANSNLELSKLKVQSLANQIRPHFLLNTLNTVGASIQEAKGEDLLDNLASSINLLFNQSISGKQVHSLSQEMKICNNIIAIYKSMYLPNLVVRQNIDLANLERIEVPFGLLQIPVENALQHGLRNKINGEAHLTITIGLNDDFYEIIIFDNGIGRQASANSSNARKHGTGLKNILEIIRILNQYNKEKIEFNISDNLNESGTIVNMKIPKHFNYDINA